MRKFSDEQLSRVLSHAEELAPGGCYRRHDFACEFSEAGCVVQAAMNIADPSDAVDARPRVAESFDLWASGRWPEDNNEQQSPDDVLRFLESIGAA